MKIGIWLGNRDYDEEHLELFNSNFDIVMLHHGWIDNHPEMWNKFDIEKWISLGLKYRPNGEIQDEVAINVSLRTIGKYGTDAEFYIDEPFSFSSTTKLKLPIPISRIEYICNMYDKELKLHDKRLRYGEGQRWYRNKKYGAAAWTYYSRWIKFLFWWIPLNIGELKFSDWLGLTGAKHINDIAEEHKLSHIWVHADRLWQLPELRKLANVYKIPLFLYIPSRYKGDEYSQRIIKFLEVIK